jgi:hypothetical protein
LVLLSTLPYGRFDFCLYAGLGLLALAHLFGFGIGRRRRGGTGLGDTAPCQ